METLKVVILLHITFAVYLVLVVYAIARRTGYEIPEFGALQRDISALSYMILKCSIRDDIKSKNIFKIPYFKLLKKLLFLVL